MLILHTFPPAAGIRSPSPPCMKAEALLRLSGVDYARNYSNVTKAPRKKLPYLVDGDVIVADSSHIHDHLVKHHGFDIDAGLTDEERALALAVQRMLEDHEYFITMYFRWMKKPAETREAFFAAIPGPLRKLVFWLVKRDVAKTLYLQGTSRHTDEQLIEASRRNLTAISTLLGNKPYFLGDTIRSIDAIMFANLEMIGACEIAGPSAEIVKSLPNLVPYMDRVRNTIFAEGHMER